MSPSEGLFTEKQRKVIENFIIDLKNEEMHKRLVFINGKRKEQNEMLQKLLDRQNSILEGNMKGWTRTVIYALVSNLIMIIISMGLLFLLLIS